MYTIKEKIFLLIQTAKLLNPLVFVCKIMIFRFFQELSLLIRQ